MPDRALLDTTAGRVIAALAATLVLAVLAGLVALWPRGSEAPPEAPAQAGASERAGCEQWSGRGCRRVAIALDDGRRSFLTLEGGRFAPPLQIGDRILVARNGAGPAAAAEPELDDRAQQPPFAFQDF